MQLKDIFQLIRVNQWIKNIVIFIPILISGMLLDPIVILKSLIVFILFALISSASYIINDILDADNDRKHPIKRSRPIATGSLTVAQGLVISLVLILTTLILSYSVFEFGYIQIVLMAYYINVFIYSKWLKYIPVVDVISISIGFLLRIFSTALIFEIRLSSTLIVLIVSFVLLISFGKRRFEFNYREASEQEFRESWGTIGAQTLDIMVAIFSATVFMSYMLFCNGFTAEVNFLYSSSYLSPILYTNKWLLITIPFAIYSLTRYIILIYNVKDRGLEDKWWKDRNMLISIFLWSITVFIVIYGDNLL